MWQRNFYIQVHCAKTYRGNRIQIVVVSERERVEEPQPHPMCSKGKSEAYSPRNQLFWDVLLGERDTWVCVYLGDSGEGMNEWMNERCCQDLHCAWFPLQLCSTWQRWGWKSMGSSLKNRGAVLLWAKWWCFPWLSHSQSGEPTMKGYVWAEKTM